MRRYSQKGIAVITTLLALAIAVLICSEVISRVYGSMKRSENYLNTQQAWEYALSGEAMAREVLAKDFENDQLSSTKVDSLQEKWAQPLQKLKVAGGTVTMEIYDAQSRFNLNNLIDESGAIQSSQVGVLQRLMAFLGVRTNYADMAARWASYENDTGDVYDTDKINYRAADTQFGSVSEMRLLSDFHTDEYQRLAPFLSALPLPVRININTAPAPVLLALTDGTEQSASLVQNFVAQRQQQAMGFSSTEAFSSLLDMGSGDGSAMENSGDENAGEDNPTTGDTDSEDADGVLSVNSEYFEVRVIAEYGKSKVWLISTLFRDEQTGEIHLLSRDTSQRFTLGQSNNKDSKGDKSNGFQIGGDSASERSGTEDNSFIGD